MNRLGIGTESRSFVVFLKDKKNDREDISHVSR